MRKSLLTKLIMFGCIFSIVPVMLVGFFSYGHSSEVIQEKVNDEKKQMIRQINSNVEQVLLTVDHSMNHITNNPLMEEAVTSSMSGRDFEIYRDLNESIRKLHSYKTKVEEVVVLNFRHDWILQNEGVEALREHPDEEQYLSYRNLEFDSSWVLMQGEDFQEQLSYSGCQNSIGLIKKLPAKRTDKFGMAIAKIPTCSLVEMINMDDLSDEVMITDENHTIVVHSNPSMIGRTLTETGYVESTDAIQGKQGQFDIVTDETPRTVTYYKSDFNHWTYLSFNSIEEMTKESQNIGWFTLIIIILLITVSLAGVFIVSRKLYFPVNKLVKNIEETWPDDKSLSTKNELQYIEDRLHEMFSTHSDLKQELHDHTLQIQHLFISKLYLGSYTTGEIKEKLDYFQLKERVETWEDMNVLTLQIDALDHSSYDWKDIELLHFAVTNIVEESIPAANKLSSVWIDKTLVSLVGSGTDPVQQAKTCMYEITERIQQNIKETLHISTSIGISSAFHEIKRASRGYLEGMEALKHRIKLGKGVVIHFNSIHKGKHSVIFSYPERTEEELIDAVKMAESEKAGVLLNKWIQKAFQNSQSPREYQISMMRLLNNLLILKQENGISFEQLEMFNASFYEEVLKLQMRDEVEEWFKSRMIEPLIHVFQARSRSQYLNISEKMIDLIHKHYDKDISLEDCAARLHYNANYLSSIFKQETTFTFSDYLTMYRFSMAKKWLLDTDMTIKEMAEKLQYKNSQNFIRSFKKLENMTPGEYRRKYKNAS
ncbi:AraC family transcriptional regulator [Salibacterium lacus]|uniref:AraC family transcriptional regulator n=1 Tax=Salibacterium lacus TaxID=1898109 RepID=A0ABW5T3Z3_9BACI